MSSVFEMAMIEGSERVNSLTRALNSMFDFPA